MRKHFCRQKLTWPQFASKSTRLATNLALSVVTTSRICGKKENCFKIKSKGLPHGVFVLAQSNGNKSSLMSRNYFRKRNGGNYKSWNSPVSLFSSLVSQFFGHLQSNELDLFRNSGNVLAWCAKLTFKKLDANTGYAKTLHFRTNL